MCASVIYTNPCPVKMTVTGMLNKTNVVFKMTILSKMGMGLERTTFCVNYGVIH